MNIKNNKRYKAGNEKIETAFLTLLYNLKYEDISINDICKKAEINRSTFYAHYSDINDLIIKIENKFANSLSSIFDFGLKMDNNAFLEMFTFVQKNKYFYKAFLNIPYTTIAETNARDNILNNIKDNNICTINSDIELYYRANFFGAGIKEVCKIWLDRDCKETPSQMAQLLKQEYGDRTLPQTSNY